MEKFTGEATRLLFPVMTSWDVTGPNIICNIIEETKALWVDFSTIQEDSVIPELIKRNSGIRLGEGSHMLPQAAQQLESNLSPLLLLLGRLRGVGWMPSCHSCLPASLFLSKGIELLTPGKGLASNSTI